MTRTSLAARTRFLAARIDRAPVFLEPHLKATFRYDWSLEKATTSDGVQPHPNARESLVISSGVDILSTGGVAATFAASKEVLRAERRQTTVRGQLSLQF